MHTGSFVHRWIKSFIVFTPSAKDYWGYKKKKNTLNKVKDSFQERQKENPNPGN